MKLFFLLVRTSLVHRLADDVKRRRTFFLVHENTGGLTQHQNPNRKFQSRKKDTSQRNQVRATREKTLGSLGPILLRVRWHYGKHQNVSRIYDNWYFYYSTCGHSSAPKRNEWVEVVKSLCCLTVNLTESTLLRLR